MLSDRQSSFDRQSKTWCCFESSPLRQPCNEWGWSSSIRQMIASSVSLRVPQRKWCHFAIRKLVRILWFIYKTLVFLASSTFLSHRSIPVVPTDWMTRLEKFSSKGNRVIALAWKPLSAENVSQAHLISRYYNYLLNSWSIFIKMINGFFHWFRTDSETDLNFIGFIVFENRIKPSTPEVIEELTQANIRSVMLTGDNMYTAISVARVCGIIRPADRVSIIHADAMGVRLEAATIEAADPKAVNVRITVLCSSLIVFYFYREYCAFSFLSDFIVVSDNFCIYPGTLFSTEVAVKFFAVAKLRSRNGHIF